MPRRRGGPARGRAPPVPVAAPISVSAVKRKFPKESEAPAAQTQVRKQAAEKAKKPKDSSDGQSSVDPVPISKPAPVEERWEESQGKYLHKKFKKMATSTVTKEEEADIIATSKTETPASNPNLVSNEIRDLSPPTMNNFPLKHNALSLVHNATGAVHSSPNPVLSINQRHQIIHQTTEASSKISTPMSFERSSSPDDHDSPTSKRRYACPFCSLVCAKPSVLDKHIRTHTNERPFPCNECGFAFKTKSNLSKHRKSRTHQLKVDQGIDSSSADIMAELGESIKEELDGFSSSLSTTVSLSSQMQMTEANTANHRSVSFQPQVPSQFINSVNYIKSSSVTNDTRQTTRLAMVHPIMRHSNGQTTVERLPPGFQIDGKNFSLPQQPVPFTQEDRTRIQEESGTHGNTELNRQIVSSSNAPTDLSIGTAKKVAAEVLQQRIDKVISENQAIVETFDSLWPRRYMRQNSKDPEVDKNRVSNRKYLFSSTASSTMTTATPVHLSSSAVISSGSGTIIRPVTRYPEPLLSYLRHPTPFVAPQRATGLTTLYFPEKDNSTGPVDLATAFSRRTTTDDQVTTSIVQGSKAILSAQSVREVWINSCRQQPMKIQHLPAAVQLQTSTAAPACRSATGVGLSEIVNVNSGSKNEVTIYRDSTEPNSIKELLLQSRNSYFPPSHQHIRRDSSSSGGSSSHTSSEFTSGKVLSSQPEVSLILTSSISGVPVPKPKSIITSFASSGIAATQSIHCNMCQNSFKGTDLELHQKEFCPARNLKRSVDPFESNAMFSPKRAKLTIIPTSMPYENPSSQTGKLIYTAGGVVSLTKTALSAPPGLLQIAQPGLQSGGSISTSSSVSVTPNATPSNTSLKIDMQSIIPSTVFSIPGVPTPSLAGVLTNIKSSSTMPFFSLPGNRTDFNGPSSSVGKNRPQTEPSDYSTTSKSVPFVFGIPGPESHASSILTHTPTEVAGRQALSLPLSDTLSKQKSPPALTITPISLVPVSVPSKTMTLISPETNEKPSSDELKASPEEGKFLRPNSLPLTPGSFKMKKQVLMNTGATSLISPETPRPRKSYCLQYQNGTAYTYLGLKCSTKVCYCCIYRLQPMYVLHKPKLSMYSNWRVVAKDYHPSGMVPKDWFSAYGASCHNTAFGIFSVAKSRSLPFGESKARDGEMIVTHSSQWKTADSPKLSPRLENGATSRVSLSEQSPPISTSSSSCTTVEGGYKSFDDDYTYVRGRGRGRYVCNSCGIRCKKPSMLKKHIRTHSNFRPYTCRHCNFAFKTKGNLTKHMKSKAHHKKCVELGISPVPTSVEDSMHDGGYSDQDGSGLHAGDSDTDDDDMDDDEDEDEDQFEDAECDDDPFPPSGTLISSAKEDKPIEDSTMQHQGLMPNRPKPSTYSSERLTREVRSDQTISSSNKEGKSEQALVSYNTDRAHDLQADATDIGLNLKQFPPPNTAEKYYFSSPASSTATLTTSYQGSLSMSSVTITQSTPRASVLPFNLSKSGSPPVSPPVLATCIKEKPGDILSPVTESASMLSYLNKTSSLMVGNGSNLYESESDPPALRAYLQERAAVRAAACNSTSLVSTVSNIVSSPILSTNTVNKSMVEPIASSLSSKTPTTTTTVTTSGSLTKPTVLNSYEDKFAPRNVTMNVKDLPEDHNSASVSRHPQLPQDIHIAAANAATAQTKAVQPGGPVLPSTTAASTSVGGATDSTKPKGPDANDGGDYNKHQIEIFQTNEDGKSVCGICGKVFPKSSHLRLHVNIHYFERPFRCDSCSVSFRTKGHLQKHKRSVGHFKKVSINATFGTPSASDPRPFKCSECKIAFRIHGHLAKHLRSKTHIMKLECVGKLPIGMYAEMERLGTNMNDIDTSDCENTLESLQQIAVRLYKLDPFKLVGKDEEAVQKLSENLANSDVSDSEDTEMMEVKSEPTANSVEDATEEKGAREDNPVSSRKLNGGHLSLRRTSFSSSGQDDVSTDSEAEKTLHCPKCPDTQFNDVNGLNLHNSVEHQGTKTSLPDTSSSVAPNRVVSFQVQREPTGGAPNVVATNRGIPGLSNGFHSAENLSMYRSQISPTSSPLNLQYRPHLTVQTHGLPSVQTPSPRTPQSTPSPLQLQSPQPARNQASTSAQIQPFQLNIQTQSSSITHGQQLQSSGSPQSQPIQLMQHVQVLNKSQFQTLPVQSQQQSQPQSLKVSNSVQLIQSSRAPILKAHSQPLHHLIKQANSQKPQSQQQNLILPQQPQPIHLLQHAQPQSFQVLPQTQPLQLTRQPVQVVHRQPRVQIPQHHHQQPVQLVAPATFSCDLCGLTGIPSREDLKQHFLSHAAPRPFVCKNCDAGFPSKPQLDAHLKLHELA